MKKNAMLKIAAILLVAVLLTTCAISATFAKYVTNGSLAAQTARAAKWGVTITASGDSAFAKEYANSTGTVVSSSTEEEVLAPGTQSLNAISVVVDITKAEVALAISSEFAVAVDNWKVGGADYFPVNFYVSESAITEDNKASAELDLDGKSETEIEAAIKDAIEDILTIDSIAPNQTTAKSVYVGWDWPTGTESENDTALGNAAAEGVAAPKITISGTVKAVQLAEDFAK